MPTRIMVVEDESIVAKDIEKTLVSSGYEVVAVASKADEALEKLDTARPDLVLMDIKLKGDVDGIDAARQIRMRRMIPIIFLTSHSDDVVIEDAKKSEPFGYIIKPFRDKELTTLVEVALYKARMESVIREREQLLSTILESLGDGVIATDEKGTVTYVNSVAGRLLNRNPQDMTGQDIRNKLSFYEGKNVDRPFNPVAKVLALNTEMSSPAARIQTAEDREIPVHYKCVPVKNSSADTSGAVLVFHDKSAWREMEDELFRAQKLESISNFAGGIAHEFNNILTPVLANLSLIKMYAKVPQDIHESILEAEEAAMRAKVLSQQMLLYSRGGVPIKKLASLTEIIKDTAEFVVKGSSVLCRFSIDESLWSVEIDIEQISQVISSIVLNAAQAMPEGGTVEIKAENITVKEGEDPAALKAGNYVKVSFLDSGIGIAERHLGKIFDPYFSTKQFGKGMGLALSYSVVKRHGGTIEVFSQLGKGTGFHLYIPAVTRHRAVVRKKESALKKGSGRVLVMDDEDAIRIMLGKVLPLLGYEADFASNGREACSLFEKSVAENKLYQVLILDLTIPGGMGGKETLKRIKEIRGDIKAIASSGYCDDPVMADYKSYGFRGYLTKPYDIKDLSTALYEAMEGIDASDSPVLPSQAGDKERRP